MYQVPCNQYGVRYLIIFLELKSLIFVTITNHYSHRQSLLSERILINIFVTVLINKIPPPKLYHLAFAINENLTIFKMRYDNIYKVIPLSNINF